MDENFVDYVVHQCCTVDSKGHRCSFTAYQDEAYCYDCLCEKEEENDGYVCDRCEEMSYDPTQHEMCTVCYELLEKDLKEIPKDLQFVQKILKILKNTKTDTITDMATLYEQIKIFDKIRVSKLNCLLE